MSVTHLRSADFCPTKPNSVESGFARNFDSGIMNTKECKVVIMLKEFKQFLLRGNVVDLAVGVVIGAAFGALVTSLVENLLTPFIGMIVKVPDFSDLSVTINSSQFMYGKLLNTLISFFLIATTIFFFIVKPINKLFEKNLKGPPVAPTTKRCQECMSEIPLEAKRCKFCAQIVNNTN